MIDDPGKQMKYLPPLQHLKHNKHDSNGHPFHTIDHSKEFDFEYETVHICL